MAQDNIETVHHIRKPERICLQHLLISGVLIMAN